MNNNVIKHINIIYMPNISPLGGIETYVYELVKKYHYLDIAVVCKYCDDLQAERIRKYCRVYIHTNQKIECKVAIINYDQSIIDYICNDAKIYQTIHADYTNKIYDKVPTPHKRIEKFIAITEYLKENMKDMLYPNELILSYNPLTIENEEKPIIIVTASRLHENKGVDLMQQFVDKMDSLNINYIFYIITNDIGCISSPNVIFIKNRLDISKFLSQATYGLLFSKSEACSYFVNEMLYRNIPMLITPLPYLKEIGVEDGKNAYIVNFDGSNIDEVIKKIPNVPSFKFKQLKDDYINIFENSVSKYKEELKMKVKVRCKQDYYDVESNEDKYCYVNKDIKPTQYEWITTRERADYLINLGLVEIIEVIPEEKKIEKSVAPKKKIEKR